MNRAQFRLALVAGFLLVFPWFLRRRPRVERRMTICMPPSAIFPYLNDLRNWPLWTVWSRRDRTHFSYTDDSTGEGAIQRWRNRRMSGALHIVRSVPDSRIDYELRMDGGTHELFGRIELEEDGACTRITWRCVWERAENPYYRYVDLLFQGVLARDFDKSLRRLKDLVEQPHEYVEL